MGIPDTSFDGLTVYTLGHSTLSTEEFIDLLWAHGVEQIADIRTVPKSRKNPQFWSDTLEESMAAVGLGYQWFEKLGGLRKVEKDSPNGAWRNKSFQGYADYMQTQGFTEGLAELQEFAALRPTTIMCAEAVPWRCHRSLVGDAILVRGGEVLDIFSKTSVKPERLTGFAQVEGTNITYPPSGDGENKR